MNCKNCGAQARLYGFCEKCWEKIWTGVDTAKTRYEEDISAGPLDPREQQMLFDSFVNSLWKVFEEEHKSSTPGAKDLRDLADAVKALVDACDAIVNAHEGAQDACMMAPNTAEPGRTQMLKREVARQQAAYAQMLAALKTLKEGP